MSLPTQAKNKRLQRWTHELSSSKTRWQPCMIRCSLLQKSSEALAEQNTQLIKSIEIFRGRVLRLGLLTITLSLVALLALYRTFP
ncbi:MAG: hypothetical protein IPJ38_03465 [Dechloromonas sp.]|uniref:Uncharacterized protein n=1 Tax=Candidatus Dechloromonas phosphorivorans TaxID=2899244 RepID=A0A935MY99_9RHOO|nr:hypothetical protein [Candidatus Dechloromonas phosphorivorans]